MAKKQFIRHLEFYGYPDQNNYSSSIGDIDLSDIREKNKEQDEEIQDLEGEKADKKDLLGLSGTVENLISAQTEINREFVDAISSITEDIDELKEIDNIYGEQLSAITDNINELIDDVDRIEDNISEISGKVEDLSVYTESSISAITSELDGKLDKDEADELYPSKDDVYTKDEIDEIVSSGFSGYATVEWVESQGYLTEAEANEKYTPKDDFTELLETVSGITDGFEEYKEETNQKLTEINSGLSEIVDDVNEINEKITAIEDTISGISETIETKADKEDIVDLNNKISGITEELEDKADERELDELRIEFQGKIDALDESKADKTDVAFVSGAVDTLSTKLDNEIARATSAETQLNDKINDVREIAESAATKVDSYETRVHNLETGLTQEIADRKQADIDLIGTSGDSKDLDTIWAAKNYGKYMKGEAVNESKIYTDNKVSTFNNALDDLRNWAEQNFSSAATTGYVEERIAETKIVITSDLEQKIIAEEQRATQRENNLDIAIGDVRQQTVNNTNKIAYNASRLNAITRWTGTNPEEYVNTGNGVLDVLHREFHEFEQTHGSIKDIKVVDGNLIITYYTEEGEKESVIPVGDLVDLSDYYTKEETDNIIEEAIAHIQLDDYYTKDETNEKISESVSGITEDIDTLAEKVEENKTNINSLFNKLGYTDNDTLVTTNQHEVAFGEYNISNTGTEPSGQTIFAIGNGTDDNNRSNALEVRKNGDVYMWVEGEYLVINNLLAMLTHEVYDEDTNNG